MSDVRDTIGQMVDLQKTDWREIMRKGVIVKLTLRRWRGKTKLTLADLGINVRDGEVQHAYQQVLRLGNKLLLPADTLKELDNIDRSARNLLERCSYKTAFGRFVPYTAFAQWEEQNAEWEQRYHDLRDAIVNDYAGIVMRLILEYTHAARHAWQVLLSTAPEQLVSLTLDEFTTAFTGQVRTHIPTPTAIYESFAYEATILQITFPDLVEGKEQEVTARDVWRQQEEQEQDDRALVEREAMLRDMNRRVVERAKREKEATITTFLGDIAAQIRTIAYETATDVLGSIENATYLPPQQARRLNTLIEQIIRLNFTDDQELSRILSQVQGMVAQPGKDRDIADLRKQLRTIAVATRAELLSLGEPPRGERAERDAVILGNVTDDEVRQARAELWPEQPMLIVVEEDVIRSLRSDAALAVSDMLADVPREARS